MDWMKLPEFLEQYPGYFRTAVVMWLVLSALLVGGFLTLRQKPTSARAAAASEQDVGTEKTAASLVRVEPGPSIDQYISATKALCGRFLELANYKKALTGKSVQWSGTVTGVNADDDGAKGSIYLTWTETNAYQTFDFWGRVSGSHVARALALRHGDQLCVRGTITWDMGTVHPAIQVDDFDVLPPLA